MDSLLKATGMPQMTIAFKMFDLMTNKDVTDLMSQLTNNPLDETIKTFFRNSLLKVVDPIVTPLFEEEGFGAHPSSVTLSIWCDKLIKNYGLDPVIGVAERNMLLSMLVGLLEPTYDSPQSMYIDLLDKLIDLATRDALKDFNSENFAQEMLDGVVEACQNLNRVMNYESMHKRPREPSTTSTSEESSGEVEDEEDCYDDIVVCQPQQKRLCRRSC